jgi:hypothetical protein
MPDNLVDKLVGLIRSIEDHTSLDDSAPSWPNIAIGGFLVVKERIVI